MNKPARIVIADHNRDFINDLKSYILGQSDMELVGVAYNGNEALEVIHQESPDLLLLDIVMPQLDGLGVLEILQSEIQRPRVIVLSAFGQELMIQRVVSLGADYYMLRPVDLDTLGKRIRQIGGQNSHTCSSVVSPLQNGIAQINKVESKDSAKDLEEEVTRMICQIGVPAHVKGYQYLREAILNVVRDISLLNSVTKDLYPLIARKYQTTPSRAERAIRHAIELAWERGNQEFINRYLGYTPNSELRKLTSAEFIARAAEKIKFK